MKYLKVFETEAARNTFKASANYIEPHVSCLSDGTSVKYNKSNIERFWTEKGNTCSLPDKFLIMEEGAYWWDLMDNNVATYETPNYIEQEYNEITYQMPNLTGWHFYDISEFNENLVEQNGVRELCFLWKISNPVEHIDSNTITRYDAHAWISSQEGNWINHSELDNVCKLLKDGDDYYVFFSYVSD